MVDRNIINKIIRTIELTENDHIVEIGAGNGVLTKEIYNKVRRFDAIEIDKKLIKHLEQSINSKNNDSFYLHNFDVLQFDLNTLFFRDKLIFAKFLTDRLSSSLRIIGNLPYNISTQILFHLWKYKKIIKDMHFMLQKEVAERLVATKSTKKYGKLTVITNYYCTSKILFDIQPNSFWPKPKIQSSFLKFIPINNDENEKKVLNEEHFKFTIKMAFKHKRKMLKFNFKNLINEHEWSYLSISPSLRAEQLSLEDFIKISNFLHRKKLTYHQ